MKSNPMFRKLHPEAVRSRRVRFLVWIGWILAWAFGVQLLAIIMVGAPREMNLGRKAQIGTDGVLIRFIWSSVGGNEIPWDEIGIWPRF